MQHKTRGRGIATRQFPVPDTASIGRIQAVDVLLAPAVNAVFLYRDAVACIVGTQKIQAYRPYFLALKIQTVHIALDILRDYSVASHADVALDRVSGFVFPEHPASLAVDGCNAAVLGPAVIRCARIDDAVLPGRCRVEDIATQGNAPFITSVRPGTLKIVIMAMAGRQSAAHDYNASYGGGEASIPPPSGFEVVMLKMPPISLR